MSDFWVTRQVLGQEGVSTALASVMYTLGRIEGFFLAKLLAFEECELDLGSYVLRRAGRPVKIEKQPLDILILLLERSGELVTREEIKKRLWNDDVFLDAKQGINNGIRKIRLALGDDSESPKYIEAVIGRGYRFKAKIRDLSRLDAATNKGLVTYNIEKLDIRGAVCEPNATQLEHSAFRRHSARSSFQPVESLAILPLADATGVAETEYFGDGITEMMIRSLSQLPGTRVMAWSTVSRYKARIVDPVTAGRQLNVRAVVSGRLLKQGDLVTLGVELVDVEDGAQLWSAHFECNISDICSMQTRVALQISDKLRVQLTGDQERWITKYPTKDSHAYQLYLRGRFHLARRTEDSLTKSLRCFEDAITLDNAYALAYVGLADGYLSAQYYSLVAPCTALPRARAAVAKALELDEFLAEAHTTKGTILSFHDWDAKEGKKNSYAPSN